jgi:hypothetical protein
MRYLLTASRPAPIRRFIALGQRKSRILNKSPPAAQTVRLSPAGWFLCTLFMSVIGKKRRAWTVAEAHFVTEISIRWPRSVTGHPSGSAKFDHNVDGDKTSIKQQWFGEKLRR